MRFLKRAQNILLDDVIRGIGLAVIHCKTDLDNLSIIQKDKHAHEILKKLPPFLFHISNVDVTLRFEIKKIQEDGNMLVNMSTKDHSKTQELRFKLQQKSFS